MIGLDAGFWAAAVDRLAAVFAAEETVLCGYDGAIGDGDHGSSMLRGFQDARNSLGEHPAAGPGDVLARTGEAFMENVGGVTGMIFGTLFTALGSHAAARADTAVLHEMFAAGLAAVRRVGKVSEGDKSVVDALAPAVMALKKAAESGLPPAAALQEAARAAEAGRDATVGMEARVGRARYQAGRGRGHIDAGAASMCLIFQALARAAAEVR